MSRIRHRLDRAAQALGCMILAANVLAAPSDGHASVPLKVEVRIESEGLKRNWGDSFVRQLEKDLAAHWRMRLAERFPHWDLLVEPQVFYGTLSIKVTEPEPNKVLIGMTWLRRDDSRERRIWSKVWLWPADIILRGHPKLEDARSRLQSKSEAMFDGPAESEVRSVLQSVPLGNKGTWKHPAGEQLRAVTSLRWDRFQPLTHSIVKVLAGNGQKVSIDGEVEDSPDVYRRPGGTEYQAIVVDPIEREDGSIGGDTPESIKSKQIGLIFLVEERQGVDEEFFDLFED